MSLLAYSGITTKVRAMKSHLLTDDQFREMASLEDVRSAADYLKQQPAYAEIFADLDDSTLHRGHVEKLLVQSEYHDFSKLYRFANLNQRKFLDLYFMHYEISLIKRTLRHVLNHETVIPDLSMFQEFYSKHSSIDPVALAQSEDLNAFLEHLQGTVYYDLLDRLSDKENVSLFDYELQLDLFYFKSIWNIKNKVLTKKERAILDACFGSRLDLLNLQWIYRAKKYYQLTAADIYAMLIPIQYKLKTAQIQQMAEAATVDDMLAVLPSTAYGNDYAIVSKEQPDVEALYQQLLGRIYDNVSRKHPYSIAILDSYLFFKERERHRIITTLEGIRYQLPPTEITHLVLEQ